MAGYIHKRKEGHSLGAKLRSKGPCNWVASNWFVGRVHWWVSVPRDSGGTNNVGVDGSSTLPAGWRGGVVATRPSRTRESRVGSSVWPSFLFLQTEP